MLIVGPPLDDTGADTDDPPPCPEGQVTFTPEGGSAEDLTSEFASGTAAAPTPWTITTPGSLAFCPGTYFVTLTVTADEATLQGADAATTILSGGGSARVVDHQGAEGLHLERLTVRDGAAVDGAGVHAPTGEVEAVDCVFTENVATNRGGAIFGVEVDVQGGALTDNAAAQFGGAIWVAGELTVTDAVIEENEVESLVGGGMYVEGGPVVLTRVRVRENVSRNIGGGLYASGATVTLVDALFEANASLLDGGGMALSGGAATLTDTVFEGNQGGEGGAAHLSGTTLVCTRTAAARGGFYGNNPGVTFIALSDATLTSERCDWGEGIDDNTRYDLSMVAQAGGEQVYDYGDDASFSCVGTTCTTDE